MSPPLLSAIYIYPVKSLAGIQVSEWPVTSKGLKYDRQWMLVDDQYKFMTQRHFPKMALISTRMTEDSIILSAPDFPDISIPLVLDKLSLVTVNIWKDHCQGSLVSREIDQWLSDFLQKPCQLIHQPEATIRKVNPDYATANDKVNFSDGFPFLIISEASLNKLNQVMGLNLSMSRFRPNLVIASCDSFAEDFWREITIGTINFRLPKPSSRCAITTIKPGTAKYGKEPLSTLNRLRKWQKKVYFGQNALHNESGHLKQGDSVSIIKTGPAQPPIPTLA